jgi:hypothetical protein
MNGTEGHGTKADLENGPSAITVLKRLRTKHGFTSQIGRRCSNILEIMDGMTRPPEEWIDYLMPDWVPVKYDANRRELARQTADLHKLLAA